MHKHDKNFDCLPKGKLGEGPHEKGLSCAQKCSRVGWVSVAAFSSAVPSFSSFFLSTSAFDAVGPLVSHLQSNFPSVPDESSKESSQGWGGVGHEFRMVGWGGVGDIQSNLIIKGHHQHTLAHGNYWESQIQLQPHT